MLNRRTLFLGLLAAPAIIRTPGLLMPVAPLIVRETRVGPMRLSAVGVRGDEVLLGNEELLNLRMEYREIRGGVVITDWTPLPPLPPQPWALESRPPRRSRYTNKGIRLA